MSFSSVVVARPLLATDDDWEGEEQWKRMWNWHFQNS